MSDLIRRQDVLKICDKYNGQGWVWSMIRKEVEELPCDGCCTAHSGYEAGMNREEAIDRLKGLFGNGYSKQEEALNMAIKALEQEPILDKIRAEIETKYGQCDICEYFEENDISEYRPIGDMADILQIIDKYKAESEDKE